MKTQGRRHMRLGEQLENAGLITPEVLSNALKGAKEAGMKLGEYLVSAGIVSEADIVKAISDQLNIPIFTPSEFPIDSDAADLIPLDVARAKRVVPLLVRDSMLYVALLDANDFQTLDDLEEMTRRLVEPVLCQRQDFMNIFKAVYGEYTAFNDLVVELSGEETETDTAQGSEDPEEIDAADSVPVIRLVNVILDEGVKAGASDIHINPEKTTVNVRYRVDGLLRRASQVPQRMLSALVSRIKIMGNMNIAETRVPQDGRFTMRIEGREINVRVSTLPTTYGENIVMRLLDMSSQRVYTLERLGMSPHDISTVNRCASKPYGMILSTGPTGSGKSSSLYAILQKLNREDINIITLEDPVEYRMEGVRQVQLNTRAGMTFASGLRSILRQDPDILMVGEIRDAETAQIAVQAAMTGHLVLSTLHTNDALSAVYRLVDMGVEPYLVGSVLLCTFAQRLVRTNCPHCREEFDPDPTMLELLHLSREDGPFYRGRGCQQCGGTGFSGRTAIFEMLPITPDIQEGITHGKSMQTLLREAIARGHRTMIDDAADKVCAGITTPEEVLRVAMV